MKTIKEINEKIRKGEVVVVTAEEIIDLVEEKGVRKAAREVDVVTTGTFGPMCSSSIYLSLKQTRPKIKLGGGKVYLNGVPGYSALAAADIYLGATALPEDDPRNRNYPGEFSYGGGDVIEELVAGKDVELVGQTYGTDGYPRKEIKTYINIKSLSDAVLFNPRNAYQNYNVAINLSNKVIYTYMGMLRPNLGNANYCSAGQLSPLLNDPNYQTIGVGTRIFLGGGVGYVVRQGTCHNPKVKRSKKGLPIGPAGTLALMGDLKEMKPEWLRATHIVGYGATLSVGIGIPVPILNEEIVKNVGVRDKDIYTRVVDYGYAYPEGKEEPLAEVNYAELKSGKINILGKEVPTGGLGSYAKAREVSEILKDWIKKGKFFLSEMVEPLPR